MPIDLVAKWLQQKNLDVTGYYSEMPEYMQLEQQSSFVARLATQITVREAILRSPEEIQKQTETAQKRVGMLVPVCGGDCTIDVYCPNQFDCIHCPAKAPDPEKRYQVEEKQRWAQEQLGQGSGNVAAISKYLASQPFDQNRNRRPIIHVPRSQAAGEQLTTIIDRQMQLEAIKPSYAGLAASCVSSKDTMLTDPLGITDFQ